MALSDDFSNTTEWVTAFYAELNEFMTGIAYRRFGEQAHASGELGLEAITDLLSP